MGDYKIGANHAGLTLLSALTAPVIDPKSSMMEYSQTVELANLKRQGLGYLVQTWHWDYMTVAQYAQMRAFIGSANVWTKVNATRTAATMAEYACTFVGPEREPDHFAGRVFDVTFELRNLVAVSA